MTTIRSESEEIWKIRNKVSEIRNAILVSRVLTALATRAPRMNTATRY